MDNINKENKLKSYLLCCRIHPVVHTQHAKRGKLSLSGTLTKKSLSLLTKVMRMKYFLAVTSMFREELTPNHQPLLRS